MDDEATEERLFIKVKTEIEDEITVVHDFIASGEPVNCIKLEELEDPLAIPENESQDPTSSTHKRLYESDEVNQNYEFESSKKFKNNTCSERSFDSIRQADAKKHFKRHLAKGDEKYSHCSFRTTKLEDNLHESNHENKGPVSKCRICACVIIEGTLEKHLIDVHNTWPKENQIIKVTTILNEKTNFADPLEIKHETPSTKTDELNIRRGSTDQTFDNILQFGDLSSNDDQRESEGDTDNQTCSSEDERQMTLFVDHVTYNSEDSRNPYTFCDSNGIRWFKCTSIGCPYKTNTLYSLKRHRVNHNFRSPLKCRYCSYSCKSHGILTSHLLQHVEAQNNFSFSSSYVKMDVNRKKWFSCAIVECPYKTHIFSLLRRHELYHERKGLFSCQLCSFSCNGQGILKRHLKQHSCTSINDVKNDGIQWTSDNIKYRGPNKSKFCFKAKYYKAFLKYNKKSRQHYYQCPECPYKNKLLKRFIQHFEKHKETVGEKCSACMFRGTIRGMKLHKLIHKSHNFLTKRAHFRRYTQCRDSVLGAQNSQETTHKTNETFENEDTDKNNVHVSGQSVQTVLKRSDSDDDSEQLESEDDITAVILKQDFSDNDESLIEARNIMEKSRIPSTSYLIQTISKDSEDDSDDDIKAVILKGDSWNLSNDIEQETEQINENNVLDSVTDVTNNHHVLCDVSDDDDDHGNASVEKQDARNHKITITITTSKNNNDTDLIKTALVAEILKSFDVSKSCVLKDDEQELQPTKTAVVTDILKSFDVPNEEEEEHNDSNTNNVESSNFIEANTQICSDTYDDEVKSFDNSNKKERSSNRNGNQKNLNLDETDVQESFENHDGVVKTVNILKAFDIPNEKEDSYTSIEDRKEDEAILEKSSVNSDDNELKHFDNFGENEEVLNSDQSGNGKNHSLNEVDIEENLECDSSNAIVSDIHNTEGESYKSSDDKKENEVYNRDHSVDFSSNTNEIENEVDIEEHSVNNNEGILFSSEIIEKNTKIHEGDTQEFLQNLHNTKSVQTTAVSDVHKEKEPGKSTNDNDENKMYVNHDDVQLKAHTDLDKKKDLTDSSDDNEKNNEVNVQQCFENCHGSSKIAILADILESLALSNKQENPQNLGVEISFQKCNKPMETTLMTDSSNAFDVRNEGESGRLNDNDNDTNQNINRSQIMQESLGMVKNTEIANQEANVLESINIRNEEEKGSETDILKSFDISLEAKSNKDSTEDGSAKTAVFPDTVKSFDAANIEKDLPSSNHNNKENETDNGKSSKTYNDDVSIQIEGILDISKSIRAVNIEENSYKLHEENEKQNMSQHEINTQNLFANDNDDVFVISDISNAINGENLEEELCKSNINKKENKDLNEINTQETFENCNRGELTKVSMIFDIPKSADADNIEAKSCRSNQDYEENKKIDNQQFLKNCNEESVKVEVTFDIPKPVDSDIVQEKLHRLNEDNEKNDNVSQIGTEENRDNDDSVKIEVVFGDSKSIDSENIEEKPGESKGDNETLNEESSNVAIKTTMISDISQSIDANHIEKEPCRLNDGEEKNNDLNEINSQESLNESLNTQASCHDQLQPSNFSDVGEEARTTVNVSNKSNSCDEISDRRIDNHQKSPPNCSISIPADKNTSHTVTDDNKNINENSNGAKEAIQNDEIIEIDIPTEQERISSNLSHLKLLKYPTRETLECIDDACPYITYNILNLKRHMAFHDGKGLLECQFCTFSCRGRSNLTQHVLQHTHSNTSIGTQWTIVERPEGTSYKNMYLCEQCDYLTGSLFCIKRHLRKHNKKEYSEGRKQGSRTRCPFCSFKAESGMIMFHLQDHIVKDGDSFRCPFCNIQNSKQEVIVSHISVHHHKSAFRAVGRQSSKDGGSASKMNIESDCSEVVKIKLGEKKIEQSQEVKENACYTKAQVNPTCNQEIPQSMNSKTDIGLKVDFNKNPDFQCMYCPMKMPNEILFKGHLKLHFKTGGVQCPLCTYRHNKTDLLKHVSCHVTNNAGVFQCPLCDTEKRSKENIEDHLKVVHSRAIFQKHNSLCSKAFCNGYC